MWGTIRPKQEDDELEINFGQVHTAAKFSRQFTLVLNPVLYTQSTII